MQKSFLLFSCIAVCWLLSCSPKYSQHLNKYIEEKDVAASPDYSNLFYWAAHPDKPDPSDSLPGFLRTKAVKDSSSDVFFLHPTTLTSREDSSWNASFSDAAINAKTDYSSILYQASAFNEFRVFAPRYRQAHLRSYYTIDTAAKVAFDLAYEDIRNAFQYYLDHENKGRPIVIASHSQGSTHAQRLLKEFFDKPVADKKLVAAYILGMYIPGDYFTHLKPCSNASETGCFVGWRTYKKGYVPDFVVKEKGTGVVVNPLTWTTAEDYAGYPLNEGGVTTDFKHLRKGIADAQIHGGILWITRPRIPGSRFLKMKNFHVGDVNLFYMNIRKNVRDRVQAHKLQN
jgi:hypothetical protein